MRMLPACLAILFWCGGLRADAEEKSFGELLSQLEHRLNNGDLPPLEVATLSIFVRQVRSSFDARDFYGLRAMLSDAGVAKQFDDAPKDVELLWIVLGEKSKEPGLFPKPPPPTPEQVAEAKRVAEAAAEAAAERQRKEDAIAATITPQELVRELPESVRGTHGGYVWGKAGATYSPDNAAKYSRLKDQAFIAQLHRDLGDQFDYGDILVRRIQRGQFQGEYSCVVFKKGDTYVSIAPHGDEFVIWHDETPLSLTYPYPYGAPHLTINQKKITDGWLIEEAKDPPGTPNVPEATAREVVHATPESFQGAFSGYQWGSAQATYIGTDVIKTHNLWRMPIQSLHDFLGDVVSFDRILVLRKQLDPHKPSIEGIILQTKAKCVGIDENRLYLWTDETPIDAKSEKTFSQWVNDKSHKTQTVQRLDHTLK